MKRLSSKDFTVPAGVELPIAVTVSINGYGEQLLDHTEIKSDVKLRSIFEFIIAHVPSISCVFVNDIPMKPLEACNALVEFDPEFIDGRNDAELSAMEVAMTYQG